MNASACGTAIASACPPGRSGAGAEHRHLVVRTAHGIPGQTEAAPAATDDSRDGHPVADRQRPHLGTDHCYRADDLVAEAHRAAADGAVVEVEVRAADPRVLDGDHRPVGAGERWGGNLLDRDRSGIPEHHRAHTRTLIAPTVRPDPARHQTPGARAAFPSPRERGGVPRSNLLSAAPRGRRRRGLSGAGRLPS